MPTAEAVDRHVGITVLGGAVGHPDSFAAHGQVPLGEAAERMTLPVGLMRQQPRLQLVFSGGEGRLLTTGVTESELARVFYQQQGLDMAEFAWKTAPARPEKTPSKLPSCWASAASCGGCW